MFLEQPHLSCHKFLLPRVYRPTLALDIWGYWSASFGSATSAAAPTTWHDSPKMTGVSGEVTVSTCTSVPTCDKQISRTLMVVIPCENMTLFHCNRQVGSTEEICKHVAQQVMMYDNIPSMSTCYCTCGDLVGQGQHGGNMGKSNGQKYPIPAPI